LTVDEELSLLEDQMRRLKVEYDIYFGGGSKKPPADIEWKVKNLLRKYSDGRLNFGQRFRFNTVQQRYALYSTQWQQKLQIKEEGYRRPQDAMLGIQGLRDEQQHEAELARRHEAVAKKSGHVSMAFSDPASESKNVEALFQALSEARAKTGEKSSANLASFKKFVQQKTDQLRKEYSCKSVEYSVELQNGQVKLKAKPKT
jgi:cysteinyl-tRNA synthetase